MIIYLYNRDQVKKPEELIKKLCLEHYDIPENVEISLNEKGKPFFINYPNVHFSVSHTFDVWAIAMAGYPLGFDIEKVDRDIENYINIAKRFFTREELGYVKTHGKKGFLQIWVRKEAVLKMTGQGLTMGLSSFNLVGQGLLLKELPFAYVEGLDLDDDLLAAYCLGNKHKDRNRDIQVYRRR